MQQEAPVLAGEETRLGGGSAYFEVELEGEGDLGDVEGGGGEGGPRDELDGICPSECEKTYMVAPSLDAWALWPEESRMVSPSEE